MHIGLSVIEYEINDFVYSEHVPALYLAGETVIEFVDFIQFVFLYI